MCHTSSFPLLCRGIIDYPCSFLPPTHITPVYLFDCQTHFLSDYPNNLHPSRNHPWAKWRPIIPFQRLQNQWPYGLITVTRMFGLIDQPTLKSWSVSFFEKIDSMLATVAQHLLSQSFRFKIGAIISGFLKRSYLENTLFIKFHN